MLSQRRFHSLLQVWCGEEQKPIIHLKRQKQDKLCMQSSCVFFIHHVLRNISICTVNKNTYHFRPKFAQFTSHNLSGNHINFPTVFKWPAYNLFLNHFNLRISFLSCEDSDSWPGRSSILKWFCWKKKNHLPLSLKRGWILHSTVLRNSLRGGSYKTSNFFMTFRLIVLLTAPFTSLFLRL